MEQFFAALDAFLEAHFVFKKVGGLWHWRIGRLGGSFYWKRAKVSRFQRPTLKARIYGMMPDALYDWFVPPVACEPVAHHEISQARINLAMRRH